MSRNLSQSIEQYEANHGWSSELFADNAVRLLKELQDAGVHLQVGRRVIYIGKGITRIKAYVHHNGRSPEFATVTNATGDELATFHYTEFDKLESFIKAMTS
jgi:hypothetical protein